MTDDNDDETGTPSNEEETIEEEVQPSHCSRWRAFYFMFSIGLIYFFVLVISCTCLYLGRVTVYHGIDKVNRTYNAMTLENFYLVIKGQSPIVGDPSNCGSVTC